ncbi:hypothetical protein C8R44DRAFT_565165, partial [Mycena epipterygia]
SPLTAFIIRAGANVGQHTGAALQAKGFQVALLSRKPVFDQLKSEGYFPVAIDAQNLESIKSAFTTINKDLGVSGVVMYNAGLFEAPPGPNAPLGLTLESFTVQTALDLSVFTAAQQALRGFRSETHKGALRTFVVTGNPLLWIPVESSAMSGSSVQRSSSPRFIPKNKFGGYIFHCAALVSPVGGAVSPISDFFTSGPQHAKVYLDLVT